MKKQLNAVLAMHDCIAELGRLNILHSCVTASKNRHTERQADRSKDRQREIYRFTGKQTHRETEPRNQLLHSQVLYKFLPQRHVIITATYCKVWLFLLTLLVRVSSSVRRNSTCFKIQYFHLVQRQHTLHMQTFLCRFRI